MSSVFARKFYRYGLPFLVLMVGGSFGLKQFTSIRYQFRKQQAVSKEELAAAGIQVKDNVTLESEYDKIKKSRNWISTSSKIFEYETPYCREDQRKILQVINAAEAEGLAQYNISKNRIGGILRHRTRKGPFNEVEQLLEVDGFGVKILEKFCESVLGTRATSAKPSTGSLYCSPKPSPSLLEDLRDFTALQVTPRKLSWARMTRNRQLIELRSVAVNPTETKRYDVVHVMDMVLPLVKEIPISDAYVIEDSIASGGNAIQPAFFGVHLQLARIQAALVALLESRDVNLQGENRRVFAMKPAHVSKLFGVRVGGERVSGQKLVTSIMEKESDVPWFSELSSVEESCRSDYEASSPVDKEMMSNALLLSLAFQNLVVERNPECFMLLRH
ncbi:unnamed protein product [Notodromas monacha]|uniref:Cytochrome c oxidase assembly protein COX16 homolog, mitochondrial n=1 Tax=Notodromas monacha TaxID=399045 RepID=A0A7R9BL09_9CRUS|nr:unnamed protein product [Notodromas monacha]CAG0917158.1 unnamed protein product [Notodromas monacha]